MKVLRCGNSLLLPSHLFFSPVLLRQSSCAFWMVKTVSTTGTLAMENSVKEEGVGAEASVYHGEVFTGKKQTWEPGLRSCATFLSDVGAEFK